MIDKPLAQTGASDDKAAKMTKNYMRPRHFEGDRREVSEFEERVIEVRRVARTVKGGRRIRFRAIVVIGNKKGKVGVGVAKANDVTEAVKKAVTRAKKSIVIVPIIDGTIPYEMTVKFGSAVVMLKPAASGTSIVAGGSIRAVAELSGITDLLSKSLGSSSKLNNIIATIKAFESFKQDYISKIKGFSDRKKESEKALAKEVAAKDEIAKNSEPEKTEDPKKAKSAAKKAAKKSMK